MYYALRGVDWGEVRKSFLAANYSTLPVFLVCLGVFYWLKAIRWKMILRPQKELSTKQVVPSMMIGFMVNNVLPMRLGEFVRAFLLAKQENLSKAGVLSTLVLERIFDLSCVLLYLAIGLSYLPEGKQGPPIDPRIIQTFTFIITSFFVVLIVYIVWTEKFIKLVEKTLGAFFFIPKGIQSKIISLLHVGESAIASLRSPKSTILIILNSIVQWFFNALMFLLALYSFGLPHSLPIAFLVMGITALAVAIPSSPGFFGVIQGCFKVALAPFGVNPGLAFSCSIFYHLAQWLPVNLVGIYYMQKIGMNLTKLEQSVEENENESTPQTENEEPSGN